MDSLLFMTMAEGLFKNSCLVVHLWSWNMKHKEKIIVFGTAKRENIDKMLNCWKKIEVKFLKLNQFRLKFEIQFEI